MKYIVLVGCAVYSVHGVQYRKDEPVGVEDSEFKFLMTRRNDAGFRYFEEFVGDEEADVEEEEKPAKPAPKRQVTKAPAKKTTAKKATTKKKTTRKAAAKPKATTTKPPASKPAGDDADGIAI